MNSKIDFDFRFQAFVPGASRGFAVLLDIPSESWHFL